MFNSYDTNGSGTELAYTKIVKVITISAFLLNKFGRFFSIVAKIEHIKVDAIFDYFS